MKYLIVDGMMSGTGIRDEVEGGYLSPESLGLSSQLLQQISCWLQAYEDAHYDQYGDKGKVAELDAEGLRIRGQLMEELPDAKVKYYSDAEMRIME
jgi:hypothetical protein